MGDILDQAFEHDGVRLNETALLFSGSSTPEVDEPDAPVGSVYFRSNGDRYVRLANTGSGVADDWELEPIANGGGPSVQLDWEFDASTTAADPGSGEFRYDNATPASVTNIYISDETKQGIDAGTIIGLLTTGSKIYIQQFEISANAQLFNVTGPATDNTGWWTIPVTHVDGASLPVDGKECLVLFFNAGGAAETLQQTYDASNPALITVNATNGGVTIRDAATPIGADLFAVEDNGPTKLFGVNVTTADFGVNAVPTADEGQNLGTNALKWQLVNARRGNFADNTDGNVNRAANGDNSVVGGRIIGPGSNNLQIGGGTYPPVGLFGNVFTYYASCTAEMELLGGGSFMVGSAFAYRANDVARIRCTAGSFGSFTGGYAYPYFGSSATTIEILNQASGAFIWAYPAGSGASRTHQFRTGTGGQGAFVSGRSQGTSDALCEATAKGAFVQGYLTGNQATRQARLRGTGAGSFTQGFVNANNATANPNLNAAGQGSFAQGACVGSSTLDATGLGSFAQGLSTGAASDLTAVGQGAFAQGRAAAGGSVQATTFGAFSQGDASGVGSDIIANGRGSMATGSALAGYNITASGPGSFAIGNADTGDIVASAANAFQLAPGTNAVPMSFQVGSATAGTRMGPDGKVGFDGVMEGNHITVTGTTHTAALEHIILCDTDTAGADITVTLPAVSGQRRIYHIKKLGTGGNVIVDGDAAETIDGNATVTITIENDSLMVYSDETAWRIL